VAVAGRRAARGRDRIVTKRTSNRHGAAMAAIPRDLRLACIDETFSPSNPTQQELTMNSIAKVLAPVTLALAAFSAHAGVLEIDSGLPPFGASATAATPARSEPSLIQVNQGAISVNPAVVDKVAPRSREDVRREAAQPRRIDLGTFA
jgi:hypothetical protein